MARTAVGVGVMARLTPEAVHAWVATSCEQQGLPLHITDPLVIEQVRVLLTGEPKPNSAGQAGPGAAGRARQREGKPAPDTRPRTPYAQSQKSESPEGLHSPGVHRLGSEGSGTDDGMVQDRPDDGGLPSQREAGPLLTKGLAVAHQPGEGVAASQP